MEIVDTKDFDKIQEHELSWWQNYPFNPRGQWTHYDKVFAKFVPDILTSMPIRTIADIGSGPVPYFNNPIFLEQDILYYAVDPLTMKYEKIEKYAKNNVVPYERLIDISALQSESIGLTICANTLDHVRDVEEMLYQLYRITSFDGYLLFYVDIEKPPDVMHPHTLNLGWLRASLQTDYAVIYAERAPSWKFKNDVFWFIGRKE